MNEFICSDGMQMKEDGLGDKNGVHMILSVGKVFIRGHELSGIDVALPL
jgi:hypothetical protein